VSYQQASDHSSESGLANQETAEAVSKVTGAGFASRQADKFDTSGVVLVYARKSKTASAQDTAFLSAERTKLFGSAAVYFADDLKNKDGLRLLAQNLKVGDALAQTYITLALAAGTSEEEIINRLKQAITALSIESWIQTSTNDGSERQEERLQQRTLARPP